MQRNSRRGSDVNKLGDLIKLERLGEGTYGTVFKVHNKKTGELSAMKQIKILGGDADGGVPSSAVREISLLRSLDHPNIIQLKEIIHGILSKPDIIPADGKLYLLFALMFKDLRQHIDGTRQQGNHLPSDIIRSYTLQILQGLDYCHKRRLFHRDLKPQNILLDEVGGLKLGDFGLAKLFGTPVRITTFEIATLRYRAPELLLEFPDYGPAIDIWSVGCVLAEMIQLTPFFKGTNPLDQIQRIFSILGTPRESSWPGISASTIYQDISYSIEQTSSLSQELSDASHEQINLLSQLFCFYPKSRISAEEALKHQYFTEILSSQENNAASS